MSTAELSNNGVIFTKMVTEKGLPVINEHFKFVERKINISSTVLGKDEILVKNLYLSLDPYMHSRMKPKESTSYVDSFTVGNVLEAGCISVVVKSNNDQWKEGDLYTGLNGWEEYSKVSPAKQGLLFKPYLKDASENGIPINYFLGLFGFTGMTAYVGLFTIGKPKQGETIFISTAAGATGNVVGQMAKLKGLKVVGSTGDDSKVDYLLNELKFDHAFNYKKVDVNQALKETCPDGIDIYFDNVGGETLDIVLTHLNKHARVVACGMSSQYTGPSYGVKNLFSIILKSVVMEGFVVVEYFEKYHGFQKETLQWFKEGKLKHMEHVVNGIENAPQTFLDMYDGKNLGKVIVKISDL